MMVYSLTDNKNNFSEWLQYQLENEIVYDDTIVPKPSDNEIENATAMASILDSEDLDYSNILTIDGRIVFARDTVKGTHIVKIAPNYSIHYVFLSKEAEERDSYYFLKRKYPVAPEQDCIVRILESFRKYEPL